MMPEAQDVQGRDESLRMRRGKGQGRASKGDR